MVPLTPLLPCAAAGHGKHKVAFLMSDGDNIQWMYNTFAVQPSWWASPDRGKVPLGWTVSPGLVELGARACAHASLWFCLWHSERCLGRLCLMILALSVASDLELPGPHRHTERRPDRRTLRHRLRL